MVKKIKKYVKFVVCMALIMGLIAPSYAALSASDGSAFVTKAEFDSALADFNARLTTFEAGINSKIDSQVTSYLDRNGIWNGKVQNLSNKDSGKVGMKITPTKTGAYSVFWRAETANWHKDDLKMSFNDLCFTSSYENENGYKMLGQLTKSGLALILYNRKTPSLTGQSFAACVSEQYEDTANNGIRCAWTYNFLTNSSDTIDGAKVLYSDIQMLSAGCMGITTVQIFPSEHIAAYVFVSKNEYLFHKWKFTYAAAHTAPYYASKQVPDSDRWFCFQYVVDSVSIY